MDETSAIRPGRSDGPEHLVKMAEIPVRPTELAYVTATSEKYRTFFAQQTKYTNESLVTHNNLINGYCQSLCGNANTSPEHQPQEVKVGDVLCTRWSRDNNWYRGYIKSCDDATRMCELYFVDYGNYDTVAYDQLVQVDPRNLPTIELAPFGFHCTLKGSDKLGPDEMKHLLNSALDEYILIKARERLDVDHWCVELPKLSYNTTFWVSYQCGKSKNKNMTESELLQAAKVDCA